jgi:hypothetical protein
VPPSRCDSRSRSSCQAWKAQNGFVLGRNSRCETRNAKRERRKAKGERRKAKGSGSERQGGNKIKTRGVHFREEVRQ